MSRRALRSLVTACLPSLTTCTSTGQPRPRPDRGLSMTAKRELGDTRMDKADLLRDLDFGGPARYRIVVQGVLEEVWTDRLAGLAIRRIDRGDHAQHTALEGSIRDQAELNGVIETLFSLHLPIVKVEQLAGETRPNDSTPRQYD